MLESLWYGLFNFLTWLLYTLIVLIVGYTWGWSENPWTEAKVPDPDNVVKIKHDKSWLKLLKWLAEILVKGARS